MSTFQKLFGYWGPSKYLKTYQGAVIPPFDTIAVVPFGTIKLGDPINPSNRALAEAGLNYEENLRKPLTLQWEFEGIAQNSPVVVGKPGADHISTRDFFLILRAARPQLKSIVILAHPMHAMRCKWVAEKLEFKVVGILDPGKVPYELGNPHIQIWCAPIYILWERVSRFHHWLKGWI